MKALAEVEPTSQTRRKFWSGLTETRYFVRYKIPSHDGRAYHVMTEMLWAFSDDGAQDQARKRLAELAAPFDVDGALRARKREVFL